MKDQSVSEAAGLTRAAIVEGLRGVGVRPGQVLLVHSAMRTLGWIDGGAKTVVDALLEVLTDTGTLVVPAFTFAHESEPDPVIDPANDASEMGAISEYVRRLPRAVRSTAFRHSFAAVGRRATVITEVDPGLSPFDLRSSFGVMLALNTQVLFLGVSYANSTSHHFAEWVCDVPYRHALPINIKVRQNDDSIRAQPTTDYQPRPSDTGSYYGTRKPDFNKLGRMLELEEKVGIGSIGNAVVRRFAMRDLIDLAGIESEKDFNVFRTEEGKTAWSDCTPLDFGQTILSPPMIDGAGRDVQYQWCVVNASELEKVKRS